MDQVHIPGIVHIRLEYDIFAESNDGGVPGRRSDNGGLGFDTIGWVADTDDGKEVWLLDGRDGNLIHQNTHTCCPEVGIGGIRENLVNPSRQYETYDKWTTWMLFFNLGNEEVHASVRDRDSTDPRSRIDEYLSSNHARTWHFARSGNFLSKRDRLSSLFSSLILNLDYSSNSTGFLIDNITITPEPSTLSLTALGIFGLLVRPRRRRLRNR